LLKHGTFRTALLAPFFNDMNHIPPGFNA